jgi:hypothetical protein
VTCLASAERYRHYSTHSIGHHPLVNRATEALAAVQRVLEGSVGLVRMLTPDGELGGRPRENLYRLTFAEARPNKLLLELDDQLLLVVTTPEIVAATDEAVRLSFSQLTFDWQEYGNMRPHASTWTAGHLDLLGQSAP